jgi:membrane protease YdiL (CAAX protease family)
MSGYVLRLALTLHIAEVAGSSEDDTPPESIPPITVGTMGSAILLVEWYRRETQRILQRVRPGSGIVVDKEVTWTFSIKSERILTYPILRNAGKITIGVVQYLVIEQSHDTMLAMSFFWQAICVEGGLAVIAILIDGLFNLRLNYWTHFWCDSEALYQIVLGLFPLAVGYFVLQAIPLAALRRVDSLVRQMFWQHMGHWKLWQLALVAALAGLGEELLFRGLLQMGLSSVFDVWWAILIASLIFGLAHAITPTYCFLAFLISLYFGWLFMSTGNLFVPIAIHALYDFFVFLFILYTPHRR